jgi:predicted metalloprotease with PDZ domain
MKLTSIAALLLLVVTGSASAAPARYRIAYSGGNSLQVEAHLPAGDGRLLVGQGGGIDQLPDQWATFVRDVRVTGANGRALATTPRGKEGWSVETSGGVDLRYRVDLTYAVEKWPAGNEQSGKLFPHALYTITKPLFVYTSTVTGATIDFDVPAGWNIAAPWTGDGAHRFTAQSLDALTGNSLVVGQFGSTAIRIGAFDVTVATPDQAAPPPRLVTALQRMGSEATTMFPATPAGAYVMTFFRADEEDGESYESSAALTSPYAFDEASMVVTGDTVVHELLHHWIGGMIAPPPEQHDSIAWFTEGFTEYYANVILARSGAVPRELMHAKLANVAAGYLYFFNSSLFHGLTLADATQKKGMYRFGIYNGGWAIALSLDVMLRSESGGKHSLADVMRLLFDRFGRTHKPVSEADIRAAASEVAGRDLAPWFEKYVHQREDLPLAATLNQLGFELRGQPYAADVYLVDVAKPTAAQSLLRAQFFGTKGSF